MSQSKLAAAFSCLAFLALAAPGLAQPAGDAIPAESVTWTASAQPADAVKPGGKLTLLLRATVAPGWHVYSLKQLPLGPNPLHVGLDAGDIAVADGAAVESKPVKAKDAAFGFETQYYDKAFTLSVPARVSTGVAPGPQAIPVTVRFQTCNGRICQPPKAVHLSVPVTVKG